ncbi:MAG TPA: twin transmembrane helix small protein [Rhodobacteraceae bacterium]|nr:twin transmembrane helix small protein [Paracoccaceae bacterium]
MFQDPLLILVLIAVGITTVILFTGIGGFARGGNFNRKYANKVMRARIVAQAIAIALILLYVYLRRGG